MKRLIFPFLTLTILIGFSSCEDTPDETPSTFTASNPTPQFNDMDGLFAAIQVLSYQDLPFVGETVIYTDVATTALLETSNTFYHAGAVSVNTYEMQLLDNNSYVLPSMSNPTSLDFDFTTNSSNNWNIAGSASVTAFNHSTANAMPGDIKFAGDYSTINPGTDLVVEIESSPINTDSILYVVAFENLTLTKTVGPSSLSATFSAAELDGASGSGVVQAAAYNYELEVINGKNYYFINESVVSQLTNL